ncbi:hypothetical protein HHJ78_10970 [Mobiluncus mulieris]|uniref:Phage recombination protein Bet n=1 Tax=Mobiluncus mulieris TaxID=2052 RepID=A0A7Y0U2Z9_9ACTO|nr:recombinase RecT [Mobiluncus mulieris]NMW66006.1 hypothetical protein [Mobiluncus mulieris]
MSDVLGIQENQTAFTPEQIQSLTQETGIPPQAAAIWAQFFHLCKQTGLDPWARQIYATTRGGKVSFQSTIDGFRLTARRACQRTGETLSELGVYWYDQDGREFTEWIPAAPPAAAKYVVQRGQGQFTGFARFDEYAGRDRRGELSYMWAKMPALMIAKCAEALALRKAFPQDLSGIYTSDEMQQAAASGITSAAVSQEEQRRDRAVKTAIAEDEERNTLVEAILEAAEPQPGLLSPEALQAMCDQLWQGRQPGAMDDWETWPLGALHTLRFYIQQVAGRDGESDD